jgi:hypothetical protein
MKSRSFLWCIVFVSTLIAPLHAQHAQFGKNKIQYSDFEWRVMSGPNVDVYHYPEEEAVARLALSWAEESFTFLERKFQHHPFRRIPLIVYSSDQHFEQTNIFPGFIPEGVLGFTEYLKRRVALPFRGDYDQFRKTLRHELIHAFQLSKLTEAQDRHPGTRGESPQMVHWWTEGLAEYWSGTQTTEDDMFVRDLVVHGKLPTIRDFTRTYSFFSYPVGAELHKYLAQRFGEEYIVRMYEDYRLYDNFEAALQGILGITLDQLSREWRYALEQRFFPHFAERPPLPVASQQVIVESGANFKPALWLPAGDSVPWLFFLSPRNGYTNLYRARLDAGERNVQTVLQGERSPQFESFHAYESATDVNATGVVTLASKFQERDALILWDAQKGELVGRYQWPDLVGIRSPRWDATGRKIVFEGLSASGFSDLYALDFNDQRRTQLTNDRYRDFDPDWSRDGRSIVFASDRTESGADGSTNLFMLDVSSMSMRHLTWGPWQDRGPRWSHDGKRIVFTSDRSGTHDLYIVDHTGEGRRITAFTGGAFDPVWLPDDRGLVFAGFHEGDFRIYRLPLKGDTTGQPRIALGSLPANSTASEQSQESNGSWQWQDVPLDLSPSIKSRPYTAWDRFSVDFAAADAIVAPGFGAAQGAQFLASDMLGNHILFASLSATQVKKLENLLDSFSGNLLYLNLSRRLNYGAGIFRFKGLFRDVALDLYEETTAGGYFIASYPFSKYHRIEMQLSAERSSRVDTEDALEGGLFGETTRPDPRDLTRRGFLTSSYLSYIKDNTLWLSTGPIDGERFNVTGGVVSCFSCSSPGAIPGTTLRRSAAGENWLITADYRRYFRTSLYSAYALRAFAFFSDGAIPARTVLGGAHRLRGYPNFSLAGSRVWLLNQEWRFPILHALTFTFPFGNLRLPGIQGSLFADVGSSWLETQKRPEGSWGSYGMGFRWSLGAPLVLRLDVGRRFKLGSEPPVVFGGGERFGATFADFFIGFNY